MRVVVQRVSQAEVKTNDGYFACIFKGLMILVGVEHRDTKEDALWLAKKVVSLRVFDDEDGVMNKSVADVDGDIMVISQFTLHAKTKKGNRPSYIEAAPPSISVPLYEFFINEIEKLINKKVASGKFGANMDVSLVNSGPVTILMDTHNKE